MFAKKIIRSFEDSNAEGGKFLTYLFLEPFGRDILPSIPSLCLEVLYYLYRDNFKCKIVYNHLSVDIFITPKYLYL